MPTYTVRSLAELGLLLTKHQAQREKRVMRAVANTAKRGVKIVQENVPRAFGDLADSVHTEGLAIVTSAPHAGAVNNGSRPHMVPLEPLTRWVKLRGMQGLQQGGRDQRGRFLAGKAKLGPTTAAHAARVATQLQSMETDGALDVDAPEKIARAIQAAIAKNGTKPYAYAPKSLPAIVRTLDELVTAALPDRGDSGGGGEAPAPKTPYRG